MDVSSGRNHREGSRERPPRSRKEAQRDSKPNRTGLTQGDDFIPIPGTTKVKYLHENLGALKIKLSPEEVKEIREFANRADATHGDRYPANMMGALFADTVELK
ncbi:hypothetical protein CPC08DRAFT_765134 [Agrocybe pediades]|nr:hypothetical protein CPC08DRAFT_765134 [Agrocybe pediades]